LRTPNYNSTKLCFVYFAFYRGKNPSKRNAWIILYAFNISQIHAISIESTSAEVTSTLVTGSAVTTTRRTGVGELATASNTRVRNSGSERPG